MWNLSNLLNMIQSQKKFTIDFLSRQGSRQDLTNCFKNTQENAKSQEQPRHSRNDKWTF